MQSPTVRFIDSHKENILKVSLTGAAVSVSYAFAKTFINSRLNKPKRELLQLTLAPSSPAALASVQEGDETGDSSPRKAVELSKVGNGGSKKRPSSLFQSFISLFQILKNANASAAPLTATLALTILARCLGETLMYRVTAGLDQSILLGGNKFDKQLTKFLLVGVPTVVIQQASHWSASALSAQVRKTLTSLLMNRLLLSPHNLCHPEELVDADRLEALMNDISMSSSLGVQIMADKLRKITDVIIHFLILVRSVGILPPVAMLLYIYVSLRIVTQQKLLKSGIVKRVNEREATLKKVLARLQRHRDDVAVWNGASAELDSISKHVSKSEAAKFDKETFEFLHNIFANLCSRVGATALGFALLGHLCAKSNEPLFSYLWTGRVMLQFTNSFSSLLEDELMAREDGSQSTLARLAASTKRLKASLVDLPNQLPPSDTLPFRVRKSNLCLNDVTGMAPDGTVLFQSLSLELSPGHSLLIQGPKSSGKSALLRLMAGTWPAVMGEVSRPKEGVFCVPSKPYLILEGSLKEQICYPESDELIDQEGLDAAIEVSRIGHLFTVNGIARNSAGSAVMGELDQQKLMIARLVYHKPKYALLDDCWNRLEAGHLYAILKYLINDLNCGVVLACANGEALKNPEFGFHFDLELTLSSHGKKPPRHDIVVNRTS